jgi:hypothetical protein
MRDSQWPVACQDCGSVGFEDETDLMPGTCPRCFDRRVAPVFRNARTLGELVCGLIEAGCHPKRIAEHIGRLVREAGLE